jgi:hypothetical protein
VINDSQVGIQRTSVLRRAEHARKNAVLGFLTDHFIAKIISLVFAAVLVLLIDRELDDTLIEADFDVHVGSVPYPSAVAGGRRQIVLETESGIAVRFVKPPSVRVAVRGPQKLLDQVQRAMVGVVPIKAEWLKVDVGGDRHSVNRTIVGADVSLGVRGVTLVLETPIQVDLDPEVMREVRLSAVPMNVPPGLLADVTFEPQTVRVFGAESLFGPAGIESIAIAVPVGGRTQEFTWQVTQLPDEVLQKYVRMAPEQRIVARVRLTKGSQATFVVKDIPMYHVRAPGSDEATVSIVGLPKGTVSATVAGTPEAVLLWKDRQDELRRMIRAEINAEKLVSAANQSPGTPAIDYLPVEVVRLPDDLRLVSTTPAQVEVNVTTKK